MHLINYNKSISKEKPLRLEKDSQLFICLGKKPYWLMCFGGNQKRPHRNAVEQAA